MSEVDGTNNTSSTLRYVRRCIRCGFEVREGGVLDALRLLGYEETHRLPFSSSNSILVIYADNSGSGGRRGTLLSSPSGFQLPWLVRNPMPLDTAKPRGVNSRIISGDVPSRWLRFPRVARPRYGPQISQRNPSRVQQRIYESES